MKTSVVLRNRSVCVALFAALICVSSIFSIPLLPGVPIVLKNMMALLAGSILGGFYGAAATALFLLAGIIGLPVFANAGGIGAFLSPAGGYMVGYLAGSLFAGLVLGLPSVRERRQTPLRSVKIAVVLFAGFLIILALGALNLLRFNTGAEKSSLAVFFSGIIPFLPGDMIKLCISVPVTILLRPVAARYINPQE
jgi:biotin transport system substrate-specific component